ncbi:MAG: hypothetical protein Q7S89_03095 [bacterium]|nr:hypothetical protein [bacterium]
MSGKIVCDSLATDLRSYAEKWADLMERWMANGKKLADIADETSVIAEVGSKRSFSPDTFKEAVVLLINAWEHGQELHAWYNAKIDRARAREHEAFATAVAQ